MAEIEFNSLTGVVVPSTEDIRADLVEKVQQAFQTNADDPLLNCDPSAPMGQFIDLIVAEIEAKNAEIAFLANNYDLETAEGVFLDAVANLYGLDRKISEATVVSCVVTGLKGTFIPYGAIAQDENSNKYRHSAGAGITLDDTGTATTTFTAIEHGEIECLAGSLNQIVTTIAGWDSITNDEAGATGRERESDAELRSRIKDSYAINANGSREVIESNLANLDGVLDCVVLENYTNAYETQYGLTLEPHSIGVCIVGGEDEDIAEIIYKRKDAGCGTTGDYEVTYVDEDHGDAKYTYNITRPEYETLTITITFYEESISDDLADAIREAVVDDVLGNGSNSRVRMASTLYASRFYPVVLGETELPVQSILMRLGDGEEGTSIDIPATSEPVITADDVVLAFGG